VCQMKLRIRLLRYVDPAVAMSICITISLVNVLLFFCIYSCFLSFALAIKKRFGADLLHD
jgi:hypothetical protein